MSAQEEYRTAVQAADRADQAFKSGLEARQREIMITGEASLTVSLRGMPGLVHACKFEGVCVSLTADEKTRRTRMEIRYTLKFDKNVGYRDSIEFIRTLPADKALLALQRACTEARTRCNQLEVRISELHSDVLKAEKLGDIVEGQEAIANMTDDDWKVVQSSINSFNRLLSVSGKQVVTRGSLLSE